MNPTRVCLTLFHQFFKLFPRAARGSFFLLIGLAAVSRCLGIDGRAGGDDATLFYASYDELLEADEAKGDPVPTQGRPEITTGEAGKIGEALDLTPLEYPRGWKTLSYSLAENLSLDEGSVECWFRPEFLRPPDEDRPFVSYFLFDIPTTLRDSNNQVIRVALTVNENAGVRKVMLLSGMAKEQGTPLPTAVVDWLPGEWHHVAMTWDKEEILVYLDGTPVVSVYSNGGLFGGDLEAIDNLVGVFCVGGAFESSAGASAGGLIDELRISNKALSADHFQSIE